MQLMLAKPIERKFLAYDVFLCVISALGYGYNYERTEDVLGFEFGRQLDIWVEKKFDLTNLRQILMRFAENESSKFLFLLVTALISIDDFDDKVGAPVIETIMARPEGNRHGFASFAEKLVSRYTEVRKPFIEATKKQEQKIDEMMIEAKCKIIYEKLHRLCVAKTLSNTADRD